ncbi:MAG: SlyX family protein [Chromatiaceae bacterium]|nr:SlyX family protein [Chromatiaceae bacterium]MCP5444671.1 SlyX family protein [Chromatiaceae bacterium]
MDKQIVELQTRLAFQENTILELSDVLARQQREIAALTTKLDLVQQQVIELMQIEPGGREAEPPPPHY